MRTLLTAAAFATVTLVPLSPLSVATEAAAQSEEEQRRRQSQTLSTNTARPLGEAFNLINMDPPQYQQALQMLNNLANRDMSPFDKSTVLEIRGGVYAATENYAASLRDYAEVLRIDALPFDRLRQIRYNVAQLYFVNEDYGQAVRYMREYLEGEGGDVEDANAWYILAAAYVQQDDYRNARRPAENVIQYQKSPEKKNFDLLNLIYSELNLNVERARLLERMIEFFPNEEPYWSQLSGAYSTADRTLDAFSTLEVAYKAGLVTDKDKIIALAQYYSALDNPYRGAQLVEAEMANGVIPRDLDNYELLAQLWSMSRNQPKAIDALNNAARLSDKGELYYRLGQSYMADERFPEAVRNLRLALNKGGLSNRDVGDIRLLIGAALFNIDSETAAGRAAARAEFVRALNFSGTRVSARGWVEYIDAIESTLRAQAEVARAQRISDLRSQVERCESIIDVAELGGNVDPERVEECRTFIPEAEVEIAELEQGVTGASDGTVGQSDEDDDAETEEADTNEG